MSENQKHYSIIFISLLNIFTFAIVLGMYNKITMLEKEVAAISAYQTAEVRELKLAIDGPIIIDTPPIDNNLIEDEEDIEIIEDETVAESKSIYADTIDNLTENEKDLIARITFREAGNQSEEGQRAVVEVILNRLNSDRWPNTVEGVLSQNRQFSTWAGRNRVSEENVNNMLYIIEKVSTEEPVLTEDYVYFNSLRNPKMNNRIKIQDHWFGT